MRLLYIFIVFAIYHVCAQITIYTDLQKPKMVGYLFKEYRMTPAHYHRQPVQYPNEWTNVTFIFPRFARSLQITGNNGNLTIGAATARVNAVLIDNVFPSYGKTIVSVIWWGQRWTLYIGIV